MPREKMIDGGLYGATITVLLVAGREGTRTAMASVLDAAPGLHLAGVAADLSGTLSMLGRCPPDVVVVDEGLLGETVARRLAALAPSTAFVVLGMSDHPGFAARARAAGAVDYVRLDDAAERVAAAVSAAGSAASSGSSASRRRTGSRAVTVVPAPGAESI